MLSSRLWLLLVATLALPFATAGCGDDGKKVDRDEDTSQDDDTSTDDEATSKDGPGAEKADARVRDASLMDASVTRPADGDRPADAGRDKDAATPDASVDSGSSTDAATSMDAGKPDASTDAAAKDAGHKPVADASADAAADAGDDDLTPLPKGTCGTFRDIRCPLGQYCEYPSLVGSGCGVPGARGMCQPLPTDCDDQPTIPVCTCGGGLFTKACKAILAGQVVDYGNLSCIL